MMVYIDLLGELSSREGTYPGVELPGISMRFNKSCCELMAMSGSGRDEVLPFEFLEYLNNIYMQYSSKTISL